MAIILFFPLSAKSLKSSVYLTLPAHLSSDSKFSMVKVKPKQKCVFSGKIFHTAFVFKFK